MRAALRDTQIYFDVDGVGLAVDATGAHERQTAFVVHGGPGGDHTGLKLRLASLAASMQLVFFDHRGQGRSARGASSRYTLDENVEDMEALRRHLGLNSIVTVGASYGGMVAMTHAARYPEAVSHLVLIATAAHSGHVDCALESLRQRGTESQRALFQDVLEGRITSIAQMRKYFEVMAPLFSVRQPQGSPLGAAILSPEAQNRAYGPGGFLRSFDLRPELSRITARTLILAGDRDWICPPDLAREIHGCIKGSTLKVFPDCGHLVATDATEATLEAIAAFVRDGTIQESGR